MTTMRVGFWYRLVALHAPNGFWETALYMVMAWLGLVGTGLLVLVPPAVHRVRARSVRVFLVRGGEGLRFMTPELGGEHSVIFDCRQMSP